MKCDRGESEDVRVHGEVFVSVGTLPLLPEEQTIYMVLITMHMHFDSLFETAINL